MRIKLILIWSFFLLSGSALAQVERLERIEIDYKDEFYVKGLYNFGENGVVLSAVEDIKRSRRDPKRMYVFYDKDLLELESIEVEVPFRHKLMATHEGETEIHTFYYDSRKGDYTVVTIDATKTSRKEFTGTIGKKLAINRFMVMGNTGVLYASTKKTRILYILNFETGEFKQVELKKGKKKNKLFVIDMLCLPGENEVAITVQEYAKKIMLSTKTYFINRDGEVSEPMALDAGRWDIDDATPTRIDDDQVLIAGTYSKMKAAGAAGMFISSYTEGDQDYFNTYDFTEYENFFKYMSNKRQKKVQKKIARRKSKGKEVSLNVKMAIHNIEKSGKLYYMLGEVYYPTYRTETRTTYVNGRPTTTTYTVFDGYQYTHAVLSTFDMDGEKVDDHIFEMWLSYKPYSVKRFIELNVDDESVKMAFVDGDVLKTKVLDQGDLVDDEDIILIGENANDKVRYSGGSVEHFYGNSFVSYGSQRIKNKKDKNVKKKRNIFYMQKIIIE